MKFFENFDFQSTLSTKNVPKFSALFIILVSLTMTLFNEKVLISNRCISGLMPNLIKKSWTDFTGPVLWNLNPYWGTSMY
jgi:hypothetical protein